MGRIRGIPAVRRSGQPGGGGAGPRIGCPWKLLVAMGASILPAGLAAEAGAYPVNFGNSYVPGPRHGVLLAIPSVSVDGSASSWQSLSFGVADRVSVGLDMLFLVLPGVRSDLGNVTLSVSYGPELPETATRVRVGPVVALRGGAFGANRIGVQGFLDRRLTDALTLYAAAAFSYQPAGQVGHLRVNAALDLRLAQWLSLGAEFLSGTPHWEFGQSAVLGVSPSLTLYLGHYSLQGALRLPLVGTDDRIAFGTPAAVFGVSYAW